MSPLPVFGTQSPDSPAALLRAFEQAQLEWCRPLGDEVTITTGYRIANLAYPGSPFGNCLLAFAPTASQHILTEFQEAQEAAATPIRMATVSTSLPNALQSETQKYFADAGWHRGTFNLLKLARIRPSKRPIEVTFLPARSALQHHENILAGRLSNPTDRAVELLHLDDPRFESIVGMIDRVPVGMVGLQSNGLTGIIRDVFVPPAFRGRGIGRRLLDHALNLSARSGHRFVMTAVHGRADLFNAAGFERVAEWTAYFRDRDNVPT